MKAKDFIRTAIISIGCSVAVVKFKDFTTKYLIIKSIKDMYDTIPGLEIFLENNGSYTSIEDLSRLNLSDVRAYYNFVYSFLSMYRMDKVIKSKE